MKLRFYSEDQIQTLKADINAGRKPCEIVKQYAKEWKRSTHAVAFKVNSLKKQMNNPVKAKKRGRPAKNPNANKLLVTPSKGIKLASGFVFDFSPKRAEMHSDHVRLYF